MPESPTKTGVAHCEGCGRTWRKPGSMPMTFRNEDKEHVEHNKTVRVSSMGITGSITIACGPVKHETPPGGPGEA